MEQIDWKDNLVLKEQIEAEQAIQEWEERQERIYWATQELKEEEKEEDIQ